MTFFTSHLQLVVATLLFIALPLHAVEQPKVPVIFDTDIGDDIDDTWALVTLLKSPQFDIKLISTDCLKSQARGKLIAKLLTVAGRTDIPIGLGPGAEGATNQDAWTEGFSLEDYPGKVHPDGVQAMIDTIKSSPRPITVIAVGPLQTVAAAIDRAPEITAQARFVGMHGSVYRGYGGSQKISAEYNVRRDAKAAQIVLSAPWQQITITPLDTCGLVNLSGNRFRKLKQCDNPLTNALLQNYQVWAEKRGQKGELTKSSTLFDTVAVYLALPGPKDLVEFQTLKIIVTDDGFTKVDEAGREMQVAVNWTSLEGFRDLLVRILAAEP